MRHVVFFTVISLVIGPLASLAQQARPASDAQIAADIDKYIQRTMTAIPELPSVAIVVIKDDKPFFLKAYGWANREAGLKADENTLYYNASSTKSYMALAAALLDRDGKVKLDAPMTKYARGITFRSSIPDKVTVRDLLTHTSGLKNSSLAWRTAFSGEIEKKELTHVFAEGTTYSDEDHGKYAYTNTGYNIYGLLLELSLNRTWQEMLREKVFRPLKLKQTATSPSKARAAGLSLAASYLFSPAAEAVVRSPLDKQDNNMQAAGGMFTSLNDLGRWLRVNIDDGVLDGKQVIPASVMKAAHTGYTDTIREEGPFPGNSKYGLGWQIGKYRNETVISHLGGYSGWSSHVSFMPDKKIGVAVMINESTAGGHMANVFATHAYDMLLGGATHDSKGQVDQLAAQYGKLKQQMIDSFRKRATRTSMLTRPLTEYTGSYRNDLMGTIVVGVEENALAVRMGYIHVVSTPYTEKDSIRVEMTPGQGETIRFAAGSDGRVSSLTYSGMQFVRSVP